MEKSYFLKIVTELDLRIENGILFHNLGDSDNINTQWSLLITIILIVIKKIQSMFQCMDRGILLR